MTTSSQVMIFLYLRMGVFQTVIDACCYSLALEAIKPDLHYITETFLNQTFSWSIMIFVIK